MAVAVQPAQLGSIATYARATASLEPDKQADVLARVPGVVLEILAEEGDLVERGQTLLRIEDDEYRHRVTLAEVEVLNTQRRFERVEQMFDQGLMAAEELDTARRDLQAAQASLELAELELSYTQVAAPFTGRVVTRFVDIGRTVANGTQLFSLVDTGRLLARVHIPAREFRNIRTEQPVVLEVPSTGDELIGRIDLVSPVVDMDSGTIKVTIEVRDYPPTTRPGDFVEVSIVTDRHQDTLLVPRLAVVTERGQRHVFVVEDDTAQRREVQVGFEDDDNAEILVGVEPGEEVVIQGQRALRDQQPVRILEPMDLEAPAGGDASA